MKMGGETWCPPPKRRANTAARHWTQRPVRHYYEFTHSVPFICILVPISEMSTSIHKKFHAWLLGHAVHWYNKLVHDEKIALFGQLNGSVLEIGPGTGINIQYYPADIDYIALEPNVWMHPYIKM
jgi:hypothetical protein